MSTFSNLALHVKMERFNIDLTLINADKSSNIYKMTKEDYKKHLENNITKTYKKSNRNKINSINRDAKKIAKKLEIDVRSFHNDQRPQR